MNETSKKVIIADDHASSVMYLSVLLRRMGFHVLPAENGVVVLKLIKITSPDLIILDYTMPVMDGITTLRHIKGDDMMKDIPVIMVTAHSHRSGVDEFRRLGAYGYLTKPINIEKLHALLQECITYTGGRKRKHLRTSFDKGVTVTHDGQSQKLYAVTLSERGLYLRTKEPLPIGSEVQIGIALANSSVTVKGSVLYHKDVFSFAIDPGMAIEFRDLSERDAEILNAYITEKLAGDLLEEQDEKIIAAKRLKG